MTQEYFAKHLSLSEWVLSADLPGRDSLIKEDGSKRKRLAFLSQTMDLPIVGTYSFGGKDLTEPSENFRAFIATAGSQPFALRASPKIPGAPVMRNRKLQVPDLVNWILRAGIRMEQYDYSFEPHIDPDLAAIFVVTDTRVVGEAIEGGILELNKGLHLQAEALNFEFDFRVWRFTSQSPRLEPFVKDAVARLNVADELVRANIEHTMGLGFRNGYLKGYFEVISSAASGIRFVDYNRELVRTAELLSPTLAPAHSASSISVIVGRSGCLGNVEGVARVITDESVESATIAPGEVLVCRFTSPEFVPLMMRASAVVTDVGGVLSHAAIVCRELRKPCVVGTRIGTSAIQTSDRIRVDGTEGAVTVVARQG